jgi:hypothetical protein
MLFKDKLFYDNPLLIPKKITTDLHRFIQINSKKIG